MTKERDVVLDILRALAILMVVTVHTWSLARIDANAYPVLSVVYACFHRCGVPLFVMISGTLQLSAPVRPLGEFYKKRYLRILIPFFIWSAIVYILSCLAGKYPDIHSLSDGVLCYIPYMLTNRINEAYWFIGLIVALYAITPFLQRTLQACSRNELIGICVVWLCYVLLRCFYPSLYLLEYTSRLTYFLGFYILGYLLYRECGKRLTAKPNAVIRAVSDCSYMIYLMHMVFITPFYMLVGFSGATAPLWQLIIMPISTSVLVVTICTFGGILIKKLLPFYRYLGIN